MGGGELKFVGLAPSLDVDAGSVEGRVYFGSVKDQYPAYSESLNILLYS